MGDGSKFGLKFEYLIQPRPEGIAQAFVIGKDFIGTGYFGVSLALAPDDSPLLLRNAGTQDVYALDWEEP